MDTHKSMEGYSQQLKRIGQELFPVLAGISFGYNLALLAGDTILNIHSSPNVLLSISLLCGALAGCLLVFFSWNIETRKTIVEIGAAIALIASLFGSVIFWSNDSSKDLLYPIRFIMGITAGLSCVALVYLVEESPKPHKRGSYLASYQFAITIGIMLAYILISVYNTAFNENDNINRYYSITFIVSAILSAVTLFTIWNMSSPKYQKWSDRHKKFSEKKEKLKAKFEEKYKEIKNIPEDKKEDRNEKYRIYKEEKDYFDNLLIEPEGTRKEPWHKVFRKPLILGIIIIGIQQVVGINVIIFKFPEVLTLFDIGKSGTLFFLLVIGLINVVSTIPGMLMIDRIGRRSLFLIGMIGMIFSLFLMTLLISNIKPNFEMIPKQYYIVENNCITCPTIMDKLSVHVSEKELCVIDSATYALHSEKGDISKCHDGERFGKEYLLSHADVCVITQKGSDFEKTMRKFFEKDRYDKKNERDLITYKLHFENGIINKINDDEAHRQFKPLLGNDSQYIGLIIFITLIIIYIIFFASTMGIIGWLVPAEILPIKIRSQGMAIVAFVHWSINLLIVSIFRIDIISSFFIVFTIFSLIALFIGFFYFPETNGKELKDIDFFWRNNGQLEEFNNPEKFKKKVEESINKSNEYMDRVENYELPKLDDTPQ